MWQVSSFKSWLRQPRLWDKFFAYVHGGFAAFRQVVREIATFHVPTRSAKKNQNRPSVELLEARLNPTFVYVTPHNYRC